MPSCNISGSVELGDGNFLGVQSVVLQGIKIGNNTRIGANSVVMRKTKDGYLYFFCETTGDGFKIGDLGSTTKEAVQDIIFLN